MFVEFFYYLKEQLPVSITEFMTLIEALNEGLIKNILDFYYISRSILCKNEHFYDIYDIAFLNFFRDASLLFPDEFKKSFLELLENEIDIINFQLNFESSLDLEDLEKEFERLLQEQDRRHDFGNKFIGTMGQSNFGNSGINEMGIRIGGEWGMENALRVAQKRIFKDYRKDIILNTRQIKVALKRLRKLDDIGKKNELNLIKTITETCRNGGEIEFIFKKKKKNNVKLILLMDVGGTMDPYIEQVNLLFSAANNISHWKDFKFYYFHNCIYNRLYEDGHRVQERSIEFDDFLRKYDSSYRLVIIGDQTMHRSELVNSYGAIYDDASNKKPGIYYINELANHFNNNIIWLNPESDTTNASSWTQLMISKIIPTFYLTIKGIEDAMDYLRVGGKNMFTTTDLLKGIPLAYY